MSQIPMEHSHMALGQVHRFEGTPINNNAAIDQSRKPDLKMNSTQSISICPGDYSLNNNVSNPESAAAPNSISHLVEDSYRVRKPNFSPGENELIVRKYIENKDLLKNRSTDAGIVENRQAVWEEIVNEVNHHFGNERTLPQIKKRWKNLTSTARRDFALAVESNSLSLLPPQVLNIIEICMPKHMTLKILLENHQNGLLNDSSFMAGGIDEESDDDDNSQIEDVKPDLAQLNRPVTSTNIRSSPLTVANTNSPLPYPSTTTVTQNAIGSSNNGTSLYWRRAPPTNFQQMSTNGNNNVVPVSNGNGEKRMRLSAPFLPPVNPFNTAPNYAPVRMQPPFEQRGPIVQSRPSYFLQPTQSVTVNGHQPRQRFSYDTPSTSTTNGMMPRMSPPNPSPPQSEKGAAQGSCCSHADCERKSKLEIEILELKKLKLQLEIEKLKKESS